MCDVRKVCGRYVLRHAKGWLGTTSGRRHAFSTHVSLHACAAGCAGQTVAAGACSGPSTHSTGHQWSLDGSVTSAKLASDAAAGELGPEMPSGSCNSQSVLPC
eukprot:365792-Chlamydomonas_euryale.AAC.2